MDTHSSAALVIVNWRYSPNQSYRTVQVGPARRTVQVGPARKTVQDIQMYTGGEYMDKKNK